MTAPLTTAPCPSAPKRAAFAFGLASLLLVVVIQATTNRADASPKLSCRRGTYKNFHGEGQPGVLPPGYVGRPFALSQDYPDTLPKTERYPWLAIDARRLTDGRVATAYINALKRYALEGNVNHDWVVQDNPIRRWYHVPWMDASADGREYIHGLTHEFDSSVQPGPPPLGPAQKHDYQTWGLVAYNNRGGYALGSMWCDPDHPNPSALNPNPGQLNAFPVGTVVWKLLFSTADPKELTYLKDTFEWQADVFATLGDKSADPTRSPATVRLIQVDVAVRDDRLPSGWAFATLAYAHGAPGATPWQRLVPLGLQWGNDPTVTPAMIKAGARLRESWVNRDVAAVRLPDNHLGFGGRLVGPLDSTTSACMSCHQAAGNPFTALVPTPGAGQTLTDREQMQWFTNTPAGMAFGDPTRVSLDYSLESTLALQRFLVSRCDVRASADTVSARGPQVKAPRELVQQNCPALVRSLSAPTRRSGRVRSGLPWWAFVATAFAIPLLALLRPKSIRTKSNRTKPTGTRPIRSKTQERLS